MRDLLKGKYDGKSCVGINSSQDQTLAPICSHSLSAAAADIKIKAF